MNISEESAFITQLRPLEYIFTQKINYGYDDYGVYRYNLEHLPDIGTVGKKIVIIRSIGMTAISWKIRMPTDFLP
ncbi:hypothetical protein NNO_0045 [Hydrogenimonas sp.]|nr:hypothetical protein NNO_0045 [Hydrogenimonas sp.]